MIIKKNLYYVVFKGFVLRRNGSLNSIKEVYN